MNDLTLMDQRFLIIRPAREDDIAEIWNLLHANSRTLTDQQIMNHLDNLVVLAKNRKILGVLYGRISSENMVINWVEAHPFYPERTIRELMIQGLRGTWFKRPKPAAWVINKSKISKGGVNNATMASRDSSL